VKPAWRLALAALPGVVVALAAFLGRPVSGRDIPAYFVPLREGTAAVLSGSRGPFWNPNVGCGEPYFANPQSGLLYPPAWLASVLPPTIAVGVEAGLHLAFLGLGCALLARRLGAGAWLDVAAGWGVVAAGPVLGAVGVLNNLDSLAWMPWLCWAALEERAVLVTVFAAASYLAAEPQLTLTSGLVALSLAPRRRVLGALVLAVGLVAVQAVPFASWVRGGNRGPGGDPLGGMAGVVVPGELVAAAVPGGRTPERIGARFVPDLTLPLWALLLGGIAAFDRRPQVRRLAWWGWGLVAASVLPWYPWGLKAWNLLTAGLVRYSGRLLFPATVTLVVAAAAAAGTRRPRPWVGAAVAVAAALDGLLLGGSALPTVLGAICAGAALVPPLAAPAALLGTVAVAVHGAPALHMEPVREATPMCLDAQRGAGRVYVVPPSWQQLKWIGVERDRRFRSLGWGYVAMRDGRRMVRTFGPLQSAQLAQQLEQADPGPAGRWWVDATGARRVVSQYPMSGFPEICRVGEFHVYDNPQAFPEAAVVRTLPPPGQPLVHCGEVLASEGRDDARRWRLRVAQGGGVFLWIETPDPGWRLLVDGRAAAPVSGVGILHGVTVSAGEHVVTARYRPPGLLAGALISLVSLCALAGVAWRRW
jgi:hypothetical protein